jgi:hypothetical protein
MLLKERIPNTEPCVAAKADGAPGIAAGPSACGLAVDARAAGEGRVASPRGRADAPPCCRPAVHAAGPGSRSNATLSETHVASPGVHVATRRSPLCPSGAARAATRHRT